MDVCFKIQASETFPERSGELGRFCFAVVYASLGPEVSCRDYAPMVAILILLNIGLSLHLRYGRC